MVNRVKLKWIIPEVEWVSTPVCNSLNPAKDIGHWWNNIIFYKLKLLACVKPDVMDATQAS